MAQSSSYAVPARRRGDAPRSSPAPYQLDDFPGCESFHLPASEVEPYEGRLESGTRAPRRPGRSASPPPSSTRGRRGGWCGWPSGSRRCAALAS